MPLCKKALLYFFVLEAYFEIVFAVNRKFLLRMCSLPTEVRLINTFLTIYINYLWDMNKTKQFFGVSLEM